MKIGRHLEIPEEHEGNAIVGLLFGLPITAALWFIFGLVVLWLRG